jgi:WD40 repeat protein
MVRILSSTANILLIFLILLYFNGCVKQAQIPPNAANTIKYYQRVAVYPRGMSKTDFSVNPDDYILVLASGKVRSPRNTDWVSFRPYSCLFMKFGKKEGYQLAVPPGDWRFFRSTEAGPITFRIGNPTTGFFNRAAGGFRIDVFVFSELNENLIFKALDSIARSNPSDAQLQSQLRQIIGQQQILAIAEASPTEIKSTAKSDFHPVETQSPKATAVADNDRTTHTIFQAGHTAAVRSAAFSPDGKYFISGSDDMTLRLWEVSTGREIREIKGHSGLISSVDFSPDGKYVVSGSRDTTIRLWEVNTGKEIRRFNGHDAAVNSVAFSLSGKIVISGGDDKTVRLWQVSTAKEIRVLKGHEGAVNSVRLDRQGKLALSGSWDGTLRLWEVATGNNIRVFEADKSCVNAVNFSPDGRFVLAGSDDGRLRMWEVNTDRSVKLFLGHTYYATCVAFSPDGKLALSGSHDNTLRLWDVASGVEVRRFEGHPKSIRSVVFSPDGRYAISGSNDASLRLWEVATGREIRAYRRQQNSIKAVAISPNGKVAIWGGDDKTVRLWEVSTGKEIKSLDGHDSSVNSVAFSPNGQFVISGSADRTLRLWEVSSGRSIKVFKSHKSSVNSVAFSPNGELVVSGSDDKTLRLWDTADGKLIRVLEEHRDAVKSVAFSPDGRFVLSASTEGFRLWEVSTGRQIKFVGGIITGLLHTVTSVAFSPDGSYLLSGTAEGDILLWKISVAKNARLFQRLLTGHSDAVNSMAFSPDGRYALSASNDKTIRLWEIATGKAVRVFAGHKNKVKSVAYSPDGKFAVSGGEDCSTRLWNLESGKELVSFHYSMNGEWMLISPDGYYDCSPEGNTLLYWVSRDGMETFAYEQFESLFKRPDIIKARLAGNIEAGIPVPAMTRPPYIDMDDHLAFKLISDKSYSLKLTASALEEVKTVRVFVNGKATLEVAVNAKEKDMALDIPLFAGANRITAVAYDDKGFSSNPKYIDVTSQHAGLAKPNLYVFAIGISRYPKMPASWQLEFAHTDAQALVNTLSKQKGKLFGDVRYDLVLNEKATSATIIDVLDGLSTIDENDMAVLFMAGHGARDEDGTFYFLTTNANIKQPHKGGISWALLGNYLDRIKGRVILLLDACHSGSIVTETVVPNDQLAQQLFSGTHGGVMVFSASKGRQYSLESPDIGGGFGLFTYALVQGLGPRAKEVDNNQNSVVEFMELVDYVRKYVNQETKGDQTPWLSRKELFGDLPLALVE